MNVHRQVSLIIVSFFLMLSGYGFAQNTKIDSLKRNSIYFSRSKVCENY